MRTHHEHQSNKPHRSAPGRLGRYLTLSVSLVIALIGGDLAFSGSLAVAQPPSNGHRELPPIADWLDDVIDDLEDIEDDLTDNEELVDSNQGPLAEPDLSRAATNLDSALATIERILDPNQYPTLDPADAGSIDTTIDPSTLPAYATDSVTLIKDAVDELATTKPDAKVVGSHLKTIQHLITRESPHNYRTKAGIG